jgi:lipid-binding SYLF domain-containing protein
MKFNIIAARRIRDIFEFKTEEQMICSRRTLTSVGMAVCVGLVGSFDALAAVSTAAEHKADPKIDAALRKLYAHNPIAKELSTRAKGILIFPRITKAGFLFGGAYGEGVLRKGGVDVASYNSVAASYGLQAGIQAFGYALFFMNDQALAYLDQSSGFEIGVGPSVVVVDAGAAKKFSTTTMTQDVYAFIFNQKGLMAGLGIEGSKITKIS